MNKLFITLVGISVTALVLAVGCGSWLFLQSWEEGKRLERQNEELKASLEASRIRIENFCEYPAEALCNVDDQPGGSVSGAMADIAHLTRNLPVSAEKNDNRTNDASTTSSQASHANTSRTELTRLEAEEPPASAVNPVIGKADITSPEPHKTAEGATPPSEKEKDIITETPSAGEVLSESRQTASADTPSIKTAAVSDKRLKKTWASLARTKDSMVLRIAGEGPALTAEGRLLRDPLRYEVTMPGRWRVYDKHPDNSLIKEMRIVSKDDDTILTFPLAGEPQHCEVRQEDPRTIAIVIR